MYPIIKKKDQAALRAYIEKFDDPGFKESIDNQTIAPEDEPALATYKKLLDFLERLEHADDPSWPHHRDIPVSVLPLHEIRISAFAHKKEGVEARLSKYEDEVREIDARPITSITVGEFKALVAGIIGDTE
ncbi:hypothetical protein [Spirosoma oryzicola]|uniref:hypothetical protein n=1 Tax=Spirosoma oryzicola TaxID=2898794 RepID=UPI001E498521|nr:hypothetical protein [Spirosoma oryzicola]UHG93259.1 hypothetical protein LQ777_10240 [Spirosoma oryzicola]